MPAPLPPAPAGGWGLPWSCRGRGLRSAPAISEERKKISARMGAISSCCKEEEEGSELITAVRDDVLAKDDKHDQERLPHKGCRIQTKFTSKATYESRFVWLNSTTKTIHMSTHDVKDKRHKEASLADVSASSP